MSDAATPPPSIRSSREAIRRSVERVVPTTPTDGTRILTPEELEEVKRQTAARLAAQELASKTDTRSLRERIKETVEKCTKTGKHALPPKKESTGPA